MTNNLTATFSSDFNRNIIRIRKGEEVLIISFEDGENAGEEYRRGQLKDGWDIDFSEIPVLSPEFGHVPQNTLVIIPDPSSNDTEPINLWVESTNTTKGHIRVQSKSLMSFARSVMEDFDGMEIDNGGAIDLVFADSVASEIMKKRETIIID